jgi:hypothetical protein
MTREEIIKAVVEGKSLTGFDLSEVNLIAVMLPAVNLSSANLWRANLAVANLKNANLKNANLKGANLWCINLANANLKYANLENVNLTSANLTGADLEGANLTDANLEKACLERVNLTDANLKRVILWRADLTNANLTGASLKNAKLPSAPAVEGLHQKMLVAIEAEPGAFSMDIQRSEGGGGCSDACTIKHCRAKWVVDLAGAEGYALEEIAGLSLASALITLASCPWLKRVPDWHASAEKALVDIRRCAEIECSMNADK